MTKKELIETIMDNMPAENSPYNRQATGYLLTIITGVIRKALQEGNDIRLAGFGTLSVSERPARIGRNPATGAEIKIPAKKVVKFKAGSALSNKIQ
jgi:DNA-binding protein HU-beta